MWDLVTKLFSAIPSAKTKTLARQVVEASLEEARQLVAADVKEMSLAEARGYVRARCGLLVRRHARLAISRDPQAETSWITAIARSAAEQMVPVLLRESKVGVPRAVEIRVAA